MKKLYTIIAVLAVSVAANAQSTKGTTTNVFPNIHQSTVPMQIKQFPASRANGDTLMYMQLPGTYVNPTDNAGFTIVTEDIDGLPTYNAGYATSFGMYYSTDSTPNMATNWYHPWETPAPMGTDTAFFFNATSWFNPAGQANNWLNFGPLTIPGAGAHLIWYERFNPWGIDGYKIYVSTTPSSVLTFSDFNDPAIFTKVDAHPSPTASTDSIWREMMVTLPAMYNGQVVSIGFNHNANDIDVFHLDEITLVEGPVGITEYAFENGARLSQNTPNPANGFTTINYELLNKSAVVLSVFDVTGKLVASQNEGNQTAGNHNIRLNTSDLAAGVYSYSLKVGNNNTSTKKMVIIK